MSQTPFDPCKLWLGIDAVDLVDPRRVLGLGPLESDPLAVLRAAEGRLERLRSVAPGPFAVAHEALMQRVEEAREAVLQQLAAAPRSAVSGTGSLAMPPPPGGGAARPTAAMPVVPRVPVVPPAPPPASPSDPWPDGGAEPRSSATGIQIRPTVVYRKSASGGGLLLVLILALAAVAGGLYWYKFHAPRRPPKPAVQVADAAASAAASAVRQGPAPARASRKERFGVPDRVVSSARPPVESGATRRTDPPRATPRPSPPPPPPTPVDAAPGGGGQPAPTEEEDAPRLDELLATTVARLRAGEYPAARTAVTEASGVAKSRASRDRVERWAELVTFSEGFAAYRKQALDAVKAGDEYDIDGKKIGVVEIDDKVFIYRFAGKNTKKTRDQIPGGILMAIVTGWFDDKPANDLYIGAYHATKEEPDLAKARTAWEKAERRGADASLLLPLLEDPLLAAPE